MLGRKICEKELQYRAITVPVQRCVNNRGLREKSMMNSVKVEREQARKIFQENDIFKLGFKH